MWYKTINLLGVAGCKNYKPIGCGLAALAGSVGLSAVMMLCPVGDNRKRWQRGGETA